jgi:hypothetical protein
MWSLLPAMRLVPLVSDRIRTDTVGGENEAVQTREVLSRTSTCSSSKPPVSVEEGKGVPHSVPSAPIWSLDKSKGFSRVLCGADVVPFSDGLLVVGVQECAFQRGYGTERTL